MNLHGSIEKLEDISSPCQARAFFNQKRWAIPDYEFYRLFLKRMEVLRKKAEHTPDEDLYLDLIEDIQIEREALRKIEDRKQPLTVKKSVYDLNGPFEITKKKIRGGRLAVTININNLYEHENLLADLERELFLFTLDVVESNKVHAANILGIADRTVRYKLNQYKKEKKS